MKEFRMEIISILLISIGLAMDAFAVAICKGISMKKIDWKKAIIIALYFRNISRWNAYCRIFFRN